MRRGSNALSLSLSATFFFPLSSLSLYVRAFAYETKKKICVSREPYAWSPSHSPRVLVHGSRGESGGSSKGFFFRTRKKLQKLIAVATSANLLHSSRFKVRLVERMETQERLKWKEREKAVWRDRSMCVCVLPGKLHRN
ncbi:hypothetical protein BC939DRAFT_92999 [Gamsiella multidivaricata]|uniref:uncharacterized protein n=1 Tax=Gamsiella multidivaricata TaxID=101098 RepID=UPI00221F1859|nr:uncharacterized protein BC939DRAFT_92999 [Gamsiella multidivaricata]KAI7827029.1 hypothetical protein BC939DRAFT_92999 [Gamsiella multidivaricata]